MVARRVAQDEHKDEIEAILREFVPQRREPSYRDFVTHNSVAGPNDFLRYEPDSTEQHYAETRLCGSERIGNPRFNCAWALACSAIGRCEMLTRDSPRASTNGRRDSNASPRAKSSSGWSRGVVCR